MGFETRSSAKVYSPQDDDTLAKIAEREAAAGNPITAEDLARYNYGTSDPKIIDEHLRDELGCYKRNPDKTFAISSDVTVRTQLLIPKPFVKPGLSVDRRHKLRVKKTPAPPPQFESCSQVKGITFAFDSSFIRPTVVEDLKKVQAELEKKPEAKVMIFGHTDKVGPDDYNKALSERRARSVYAFITNKTDIWEELYQEENWGTRAVQEILADQGYDPGPVDGIDGPQTRSAVKAFQSDHQPLNPDGIAGPKTRKELFTAYMSGKHDIEIDDSRFMEPKHMGCGEFNPQVPTADACEDNRRVTLFLFNQGRLPNLPCKAGDTRPCRRQMTQPAPRFKDSFQCSFYDSIARQCPCEGGGGAPAVVRALDITAVDHHFAPSSESLDIRYRIQGVTPEVVRYRIYGEQYPGQVLFERNLTPEEAADGDDKPLTWDGRINQGERNGRFAHPLLGPFRVELFVAGDCQDAEPFRILYHSIVLDWGKHTPDGALPPPGQRVAFAKATLDQLGYDAGPVNDAADATFQSAVRRFQRANYRPGTTTLLAETGNLDDDTFAAIQGAAARTVWQEGTNPLTQDARFYVHENYFNDRGADFVTTNLPQFNSMDRQRHVEDKLTRAFLPLEVEIRLASKADAGVSAPEAIGPVTTAWEADDGPEDAGVVPAATNATARTYVQRARQFGAGADTGTAARVDGNGDNALISLRGFRNASPGANIQQWFPQGTDSVLAPFAVRGYGTEAREGKTFHRALVDAWDHATDHPARRGRAGVYLRMSTKGGDDAKVRVSLTFAGLPQQAALEADHKDRVDDLAKETGRWTVWRRGRMNAYCQQAAPTRLSGSPNWGDIADRWHEAFYELENNGSPEEVLTYTAVVPEATYKNAILGMPATRRPAGVTDAASLTYRPTCIYGGPIIRQAPGEPAQAFVTRAENAMRAWITNPLNAILGVIHDHVRTTRAEGLIIFDFRIHEPVTGQDWNPALNGGHGGFQPSANPAVQNQIASTAGYVRLDGAVTMNVDNPFNVHCYVRHECGHAKFLYHFKTGGGGGGDPVQTPHHHDADQERCTMSYAIGGDAPDAWRYPFCGKCVLRLRGWNVLALPDRYT